VSLQSCTSTPASITLRSTTRPTRKRHATCGRSGSERFAGLSVCSRSCRHRQERARQLTTTVGPETVASGERVPLRCSGPTNLGLKDGESSSRAREAINGSEPGQDPPAPLRCGIALRRAVRPRLRSPVLLSGAPPRRVRFY
jgi:hypothetical protein